MSLGFQIAVFVFSLAVSFLLSGMEAGVAALSRVRIRHLMRAGAPSARVLHGYLEQPEPFLWTIITGNTLANFVAFALATHWLVAAFGGWTLWLGATLVVVAFAFYGGVDLLPKLLFRAFPNRLCLALARPFRLVDVLLAPLVELTAWSSRLILRRTGKQAHTGRSFGTREEFRFVMQESAGALTSAERTMINRVLDFQHLTVGTITTPMAKVVSVGSTLPLREALAISRERGLTRLPVWEDVERGRRVAGVLSFKRILYLPELDGAKPVGEFLQPALYLDGQLRLEEALRRMQRSGQRLGVVLDRDRREIGIVTLQDILKVILGEVSI